MTRVTLAALLFAAAAPLQAQYTLPQVQLRTGTRVRVTAPEVLPVRVTGLVVARDPEGLSLSKDRGKVQLTFTPQQIELLEVSEGRNRLKWSLIGGAAGMLGGAVLGGWQGGRQDPSGIGAFIGFLGGGDFGSLGGAVVGAVVAPERWQRYRIAGAAGGR